MLCLVFLLLVFVLAKLGAMALSAKTKTAHCSGTRHVDHDELVEVVVILRCLAVRIILGPRLAHGTGQDSPLAAFGVGLVQAI